MKKIKFLSACVVLFTASFFTSCSTDVEPLSPDVVLTPEPGDGEEGETTGDYWPMAVNNQWTFSANGNNEAPMKIVSTEQIGGNTYYKYDNFFGSSTAGTGFEATVWTRKSNGVYYVRQQAVSTAGQVPAITVEPFEVIILKDFLEATETWQQTVSQSTIIEGFPPIVTEINIEGEILEKDITLAVNGQEFSDVIKVKVVQNTQGVTNTNYYWFSKNVGVIKYQQIYQGFDTTHDIVSYTVN